MTQICLLKKIFKILEVLSIYSILKESSLAPNPTTPCTKESHGAKKVDSSAACRNTFCSVARYTNSQKQESHFQSGELACLQEDRSWESMSSCQSKGQGGHASVGLCHSADVWPAARHLTFLCSISPVCGMAGTPLTCLQAWWGALCGLGMKVASQRNILGFYFDVCKFVLFYYLIESVSFCFFSK